MIKTQLRLAASAAAIALLATPALAQDFPEDEIIVTATKRQTTLQDTPVAVTVTDFETIERAEIQDLLDLQSVVPSLRVSQLQASTQTNFIIRGFGNGANNPGIEPSVGVFIDGVYRSRSAAQIGDLPRLQRVEVLAGPQSTLFGKNASAGVVSIVTEAPQFDPSGYVELGAGNFNLIQGKAYYTNAINDNVAFSLGGSFQNRDGYFARAGGNGDELNDRNRFNLRGQLLLAPNDDTEVRLIADYGRIDELCCGTATFVQSPVSLLLTGIGQNQIQGSPAEPFARVAFTDITPVNELDDWGLSMQVDHDFGNDLSLTSITAYRENDSFSNIDADFTLLNLLDENVRDDSINTFTQELRLTSNYDGKFNYQLGGFLFLEEVDSFNTIGYGDDLRAYIGTLAMGAFDLIEAANPQFAAGEFFGDQVLIEESFTQDDTTFSLFGTVDYEVSDRLTLTGGLNYTSANKEVTGSSVNNDTFSNIDLTGPVAANSAVLQGLLTNFPNVALACGLGPLPFSPANIGAVSGVAACPGLGGVPGAAAFAGLQAQVGAGVAALDLTDPAQNPFLGLVPFQFQPQFLAFPNDVESGEVTDDKLTWSVRANFEATDDLSLYASAATGFKASSFNLSRDSRPFLRDAQALAAAGLLPNNYIPATGRNFGTRFAEPEEALVFEVGAKARFDRGNLNIAAFTQTLENFQTNAFVGAQFVLANAGETRVNGIEVQGLYRPLDWIKFDYAGTFLDAEYTDFTNASGPDGGVVDLTGTEPDNINDVSLSLGLTFEHDFDNGMMGYVRGDYQYESPTTIATNLTLQGQAIAAQSNPLNATLGFTPGFEEREQNLVNVSAGLEFQNGFQVQVWGRNVFGDDFATTLFPGVAQFGIVNGYPSPPATYGVNLRKEF